VVASLHNRMALEILTPNLGGPITDTQEVFEVTGVSLDVVDGTVMLALLQTELQVNFDLLSLVSLEDVALLSSHKVLERGRICVVFKTGASKSLGDGLSVDREVLNKLELLSGASLKVSLIPPEETSIGGCGYAFGTGFTSDPVNIVDWVSVRLLED